MGAQSWW